jgi:glyoxylase-like metal-dependent hydrolase (beta-lactamase superfamily II)
VTGSRHPGVGLLVLLALGCRARPDTAAASAARWCDQVPRAEFKSLEHLGTKADWFEVYRVDSGVYAIAEPYQFQEVISYLIVGSERALLFDTGLGMVPIRPVVAELTTLPVSVLNSHTHYDHVGGNAEFDSVFAIDTDYTRANTAGFPHELLKGEASPEAFCRPARGLDPAAFATKPYRPARFISDGYRVELGGRTIQVLQVPGHTPDAVALVDSAAGLLWTGDSFYPGPIWLYVPETDIDAYRASVDRLVAWAPRVRKVLGAHNVAVSEPGRLTDLQVAVARVLGGEAKPIAKGDGRVEFLFEGFSILTAPQVLERRARDLTKGGSGLSTW